jgi:hypothetical protein
MQIDAQVLVNHAVFIFMVHSLGQRSDLELSRSCKSNSSGIRRRGVW